MRPAIALLIPLLLACSTGEDLFGGGVRQAPTTGSSGGEGGRQATSSTKATSGEPANTNTTMQASSSSGEDICRPDDQDTPCAKCAKMNCCPQLQQCGNDDNCSCWVECYNDGNGFFECQNNCGPQGATFAMLEGCVGGPCFLDCT